MSRLFAASAAVLAALNLVPSAATGLMFSLSPAADRVCRKIEFEGSVARGQDFTRGLTPTFNFNLQPEADGWRIRVLAVPSHAPHDSAEVATPPYQSAGPLLLTTEYNFRAQDVVAWNPRDFQFVTSVETNTSGSRDVDTLLDKSLALPGKASAEKRLIEVATHAAHGELRILDAALVPGTADQSPAAAAVASHWRTTAHTLVQPQQGKSATPLGEVESLKFRVTLWMPRSIPLLREWKSAALVNCPQ